jgi:hypothetical protein
MDQSTKEIKRESLRQRFKTLKEEAESTQQEWDGAQESERVKLERRLQNCFESMERIENDLDQIDLTLPKGTPRKKGSQSSAPLQGEQKLDNLAHEITQLEEELFSIREDLESSTKEISQLPNVRAVGSLHDLLRQCTVRIDAAKGKEGIGFFVAPGKVMTSYSLIAHLCEQNKPIDIWLERAGQPLRGRIWNYGAHKHIYQQLDVAIVTVPTKNDCCVRLTTGAAIGDEVLVYEIIKRQGNEHTQLLNARITTQVQQRGIRTCLLSTNSPGRSGQKNSIFGAPLIHEGGGTVVGMISRNETHSVGGYAILVESIADNLPNVMMENRDFHAHNKCWRSHEHYRAVKQRRCIALLIGAGIYQRPHNYGEKRECIMYTELVRDLINNRTDEVQTLLFDRATSMLIDSQIKDFITRNMNTSCFICIAGDLIKNTNHIRLYPSGDKISLDILFDKLEKMAMYDISIFVFLLIENIPDQYLNRINNTKNITIVAWKSGRTTYNQMYQNLKFAMSKYGAMILASELCNGLESNNTIIKRVGNDFFVFRSPVDK